MKPYFRLFLVGVGVIGLLVPVIFVWVSEDKHSAHQATELLRQARLLKARGDIAEAEQAAREAIAINSDLSTAHQLAADCSFIQGNHERALLDLSQIGYSDSDEWRSARLLAAEILHHHVFRLGEAEQAYRDVLEVAPDNIEANDGYARLLGVCGRRSEAIPFILRLLRSGEETDLLILLARESGMMTDVNLLAAARKAAPADPNPLIGQAAAAAGDQQGLVALERLQQAATLNNLPPSLHGLLGIQLLANKKFAELAPWFQSLKIEDASHDSWIVLAAMAERAGDVSAAIRCYWEAVRRQPESLSALNQLAQKLASVGQGELAKPFQRRVGQINELRDAQQRAIMSGPQPQFQDVLDMVRAYASVGRFFEAYSWGRIAASMEPQNAELQTLVQNVASDLRNLPLQLTAPDYNPAYQVDLSTFPLPSLFESVPEPVSKSASKNIFFEQQRDEIGFRFRYYNGSDVTTRRMFEFGGGGLAVIDFDHDGKPDLMCTQGIPWDTGERRVSDQRDHLFRNRMGNSFVDVAEEALIAGEVGFGQGASSGDVNNDGFADLYVANTGLNTLWINNGDGTFTERSFMSPADSSDWTTSCLIADLNGDGAPDLYDVNYLAGADVFDRTCLEEHGDSIMCAPYDFEAAVDRIWLGDGTGRFRDATSDFLSTVPNGKGLGILAWNRGDNQLSVFVSNDTTANFLFTTNPVNSSQLYDTAVSAGLAFNGDGKAEACMGIAAADCTEDGHIDLFVTNFLYESNTLYSPVTEHLFEDQTRILGLHESSLPVLGFGTQFLDANLDGRFELFVANGFTQDLSKYGTPYQMPPQIFEWTGTEFQMLPPGQAGPWSQAASVGRAVAKLDWNLDGKPDLVVGALDGPSSILTNRSSVGNNGLALTLVAKTTARDAIGTTVTVSIGDRNFVHQLMAGDGYQCSNQRCILIGCGSADVVETLTIEWPSGTRQQFFNVPVPECQTLVEGQRLLGTRLAK